MVSEKKWGGLYPVCSATHVILIGPMGNLNTLWEPTSNESSALTSSATSHGGISLRKDPSCSNQAKVDSASASTSVSCLYWYIVKNSKSFVFHMLYEIGPSSANLG